MTGVSNHIKTINRKRSFKSFQCIWWSPCSCFVQIACLVTVSGLWTIQFQSFFKEIAERSCGECHPGGNLVTRWVAFHIVWKPLKLEDIELELHRFFSTCFFCLLVWSLKKILKFIGYRVKITESFQVPIDLRGFEVEIRVSKSVQDYRILQALKAFKLLGRLPKMHKWTFWAEGFSDLDVLILNGPLIGD